MCSMVAGNKVEERSQDHRNGAGHDHESCSSTPSALLAQVVAPLVAFKNRGYWGYRGVSLGAAARRCAGSTPLEGSIVGSGRRDSAFITSANGGRSGGRNRTS